MLRLHLLALDSRRLRGSLSWLLALDSVTVFKDCSLTQSRGSEEDAHTPDGGFAVKR